MSRKSAVNLFDPAARRLARGHLRASEPRMAALVQRYGDVWPKRPTSALQGMMSLIIDQQISIHAARSIRERLHARVGGRWQAERLRSLSDDELGRCGLSRPKQRTVRAVLAALEERSLRWNRLRTMSDAEVLTALTAIKGIGPWTAQMYLLFALGRPDVLAPADLGLQNAARQVYGLRKRPSAARFEQLSRPWAPYRSLASVYLWASLEKGNWPGESVED